eukprot:982496_1
MMTQQRNNASTNEIDRHKETQLLSTLIELALEGQPLKKQKDNTKHENNNNDNINDNDIIHHIQITDTNKSQNNLILKGDEVKKDKIFDENPSIIDINKG